MSVGGNVMGTLAGCTGSILSGGFAIIVAMAAVAAVCVLCRKRSESK